MCAHKKTSRSQITPIIIVILKVDSCNYYVIFVPLQDFRIILIFFKIFRCYYRKVNLPKLFCHYSSEWVCEAVSHLRLSITHKQCEFAPTCKCRAGLELLFPVDNSVPHPGPVWVGGFHRFPWPGGAPGLLQPFSPIAQPLAGCRLQAGSSSPDPQPMDVGFALTKAI